MLHLFPLYATVSHPRRDKLNDNYLAVIYSNNNLIQIIFLYLLIFLRTVDPMLKEKKEKTFNKSLLHTILNFSVVQVNLQYQSDVILNRKSLELQLK